MLFIHAVLFIAVAATFIAAGWQPTADANNAAAMLALLLLVLGLPLSLLSYVFVPSSRLGEQPWMLALVL